MASSARSSSSSISSSRVAGAARARGGTSGCRSRGRRRRCRDSSCRCARRAASWPTTKNVIVEAALVEHVEDARHDDVEVATEAPPSRRRRGSSGTTTGCRGRATGCAVRGCVIASVSRSSSATARSASCTVSFTFSVPLTMCAELTRTRPGTDVRIGGIVRGVVERRDREHVAHARHLGTRARRRRPRSGYIAPQVRQERRRRSRRRSPSNSGSSGVDVLRAGRRARGRRTAAGRRAPTSRRPR